MTQRGTQAQKTTKARSQDANRPFKELRSGSLKAVIWENQVPTGRMFNTVLLRVFKNDREEWQETTSLGRDDLLLAAKLLDQAHTIIMREEEADRQRQRESRAA